MPFGGAGIWIDACSVVWNATLRMVWTSTAGTMQAGRRCMKLSIRISWMLLRFFCNMAPVLTTWQLMAQREFSACTRTAHTLCQKFRVSSRADVHLTRLSCMSRWSGNFPVISICIITSKQLKKKQDVSRSHYRLYIFHHVLPGGDQYISALFYLFRPLWLTLQIASKL